ncbi:signal transduction histidine kinase-like protein [Actinomadura verrucosospora]|uniref:histidine kinase n=1 Tax=Actinomadura verrucosospora TaxID=46165 RepID=A0A7D4AH02_ACTVE|nr:signal transduction histidine kinase-like protein [Actinomadura verrucosospora]
MAALVVTVVMSAVAVKPGDRPLWPGGLALIAVTTLPLVWRRRHPVVLLVVATVVPPLYYPLGYPDGPIAFVFLVALFNAAVQCRLAVSLGAVIVVNAGFLTTSAVRGGGGGDPDAVADPRGVASLSLALLVTIGVGQYVRGRRIRLEEAERRAAEAERGREEEALRREAQERLRIARELHDVLAHQISLINVQAGAALHRRDDAARAYAALEAIKAASRQTLRELRGVLGVLRQVDEAGGAGPVEPVPSLARVGELLERTRAAGLRVRRAGDLAAASSADAAADDGEGGGEGGGALAGVPAPVGLAGYRIVQEALTNVVRHAGAASVTVDVRCTADAVIVQIDDDGAGPPRDSAGPGGPSGPGGRSRGNGLRGMRERAAAVGGELAAGPGPDGGFRVRARLPLDAPSGAGRGRDEGAGEQVADGEPMREDT